MEHKSFSFEVKEVEESGQFTGYASTFGNTDSVGDIVEAGAFSQTLKETGGVYPILWQHDYRNVVGFGVQAVQDFKGLLVKGEFTLSHPQGQMAYATVQHAQRVGHKMGLSIGFTLDRKGSWEMDGTIRRLKKINLAEYSLATFPANPKATVQRVKSVEDLTEREFEEFLREAGFSKSEALCVSTRGFKTLMKERREAVSVDDDDDETAMRLLKTMQDDLQVQAQLASMGRSL